MAINNFLEIKPNAIDNIYNVLSKNNIKGKILFVTDANIDKLYGKKVKEQLVVLGKVKSELIEHNTITYSMCLAERMIATDVDYIVGLGGGKVLDVCKYAGYVAKRPFISIPTAMANDGLASPIAVLKRQDNLPKSLGCMMPSIIIIDTKLIQNGPHSLIQAGIGDTISNYMALMDWTFAAKRGMDTMNGFAYLMSHTSLDALLKTQYNTICPEFVDVLANSLVLSGIAMDFAGSSRPVSGSEHLFSHALDYYCDKKNLHGIHTALGTVAVLKLLGKQRDYLQVDDETDFNYATVLNYLNRFQVEINPVKLGITKENFVVCMQKGTSMRSNRYTYLHEANLDTRILYNIYDELVEEL